MITARRVAICCFLLAVAVPAAFVCTEIYSSDDCSGDLKRPIECSHDGKCFMTDVPVIEICNANNGPQFTTFRYDINDVDCNGTATAMTSYDLDGCVVSGTDTVRWTCTSTLPAGAKILETGQYRPFRTQSDDYYATSQPAYAFDDVPVEDGNGATLDEIVSWRFDGNVPEDALLQLMDANRADYANGEGNYSANSEIWYQTTMRWYPLSNSTFKAKSFIHKMRCGNGNNGTSVTACTGSGATYKKCPQQTWQKPIANVFLVAPFLCQETCDKDLSCIAYVVDGAGARCWILHAGPGADHTAYFRISD